MQGNLLDQNLAAQPLNTTKYQYVKNSQQHWVCFLIPFQSTGTAHPNCAVLGSHVNTEETSIEDQCPQGRRCAHNQFACYRIPIFKIDKHQKTEFMACYYRTHNKSVEVEFHTKSLFTC